jgi:hypothetical protein
VVHKKREADAANKKTGAETVFTIEGATIETLSEHKCFNRSNSDSELPVGSGSPHLLHTTSTMARAHLNGGD